ncbi:hypothetical protein [Dongia sedimenti]|uniref:Uncharacterized protein n=1 Tax=Dongia sedimenti TaxID=3064282 RepID=A0ABU0YM24_9PROT|nr:hypothetical protein [Rhodospirillaceae bacterium R-7]
MQMPAAGDDASARPRAVQHPVACEKLPNVPGSPTEPAEIMAIFVADSDCGALTIFDD